jgi:alpha/beta superfamily hydrolase
MSLTEIRSGVELPVERHALTLQTADGQQLVAELALPVGKPAKATLICLHPLPTHGGFMDSHVMRKASNRLPYLADVAVLRFNTRGTSSPHGTSTGAFDGGVAERFDLEAAVAYAVAAGLPNRWLLGWSFGTELALKYGANQDVLGAILMSPPLHRATQQDLEVWNHNDKRVVGIIPEFDDYLVPADAAVGFAVMRKFEQVNIDGGKHLWVGEEQVRQVLNEIVKVAAPWAYPLPNEVELPGAV